MLSASQAGSIPMSDFSQNSPPDHLSNDPRSKFHDADLLERGIGIRFKGIERSDVEDYCVNERWIRVAAGRALDRRGNPITFKHSGPVEPFFKDNAPAG